MVKKQTLFTGLVVLAVVSLIFTLAFYEFALDIAGVVEIDIEDAAIDSSAAGKPVVYLSVISRYPPNVIYSGYQPMLNYMTSRTPYRFELKLCDDYNQAVEMLLNKEVAGAFLGSYVYIRARREHGVIPILKPLNSNSEPFSRSVLFTSSSKDIFNISDLKGKRLALPSKESNSSNWILRSEFRKNSLRPEDLRAIVNFPHHQSVIHQVMNGSYDAGVTREYLIRKIQGRNIRVLVYSDPFPTSPIVVPHDYAPDVVRAIKEVLLSIASSGPERAAITRGWDNEFIYGFVEANDSDYDAIRAISAQ